MENMVFDIELIGVNNPKVKRTLSVPASMTFQQLHGIIQIAFGWENEHLYDFQNRPKDVDNDDGGFLEWAFGTLAKARKVDINKLSITKINKALQKGFGLI
ncbi:MAG: hypothetical protein HUJ91_07355 [Bacteroidales bacterium]|nr:hypothetical protein [Bacteroidales bacterium]